MQLAVLGGHTDVVQELADKFPLSVKFVTQVNILVTVITQSQQSKIK